MVGLVLVCHSAKLAEGVAELAAQMGGEGLRIGVAGGLDQPGSALGTDALRVARAVEDVWSEDGVLVLMDLGSAGDRHRRGAAAAGDSRRRAGRPVAGLRR